MSGARESERLRVKEGKSNQGAQTALVRIFQRFRKSVNALIRTGVLTLILNSAVLTSCSFACYYVLFKRRVYAHADPLSSGTRPIVHPEAEIRASLSVSFLMLSSVIRHLYMAAIPFLFLLDACSGATP
jgi:hypothetical protein